MAAKVQEQEQLDKQQKEHREAYLSSVIPVATGILKVGVYDRIRAISEANWEEATIADDTALITEQVEQGKARLNWQTAIEGFSNVKKLVHLSARMDSVAIEGLRKELQAERAKAYEDELSLQAARIGCSGQKGLLNDNSVRSKMNTDSQANAESIANTYNYDLAKAIGVIRAETPTANRNVYAKRLGAWEKIRLEGKAPVVSMNTVGTARAMAQQDFYMFNDAKGFAFLRPELAKCPICIGWVNRGKVPLAEAQLNPPPYHIRCPHLWETFPETVQDCRLLWMGGMNK